MGYASWMKSVENGGIVDGSDEDNGLGYDEEYSLCLSLSSMEPTPPASPDTINSNNSISSTNGLNLNDLHTIFCDCGEKIAEKKGEVERMKEEMGRDYLHSRVDVLNM
ncbi:unnamed protein product [Lactuca saligna]|uniref:Uncharacterized protein n=1 Tax=Lactuca saligna TaxID=75948 RepID=A0AA36EI61_LACSI|nr:unnamed protein product [Lactuca saligna]